VSFGVLGLITSSNLVGCCTGRSPDHEQNAADLRQQRQQDKPEHCEVIAGGL
jgi:hypothetical protein